MSSLARCLRPCNRWKTGPTSPGSSLLSLSLCAPHRHTPGLALSPPTSSDLGPDCTQVGIRHAHVSSRLHRICVSGSATVSHHSQRFTSLLANTRWDTVTPLFVCHSVDAARDFSFRTMPSSTFSPESLQENAGAGLRTPTRSRDLAQPVPCPWDFLRAEPRGLPPETVTPFPQLLLFRFLRCFHLNLLTRTSSAILNRSGGSGHRGLIPVPIFIV